MYEFDRNLRPAVRKRAEVLVLAIWKVVWEFLAELAFVATRVVQLLDFVVGLRAAVAQQAELVVFA